MLLNYINAKKCQAKLVKNPYGVRAAKISHHVLWLHHQKLIQLIKKQGLLEVTSSPAVNRRDLPVGSTPLRAVACRWWSPSCIQVQWCPAPAPMWPQEPQWVWSTQSGQDTQLGSFFGQQLWFRSACSCGYSLLYMHPDLDTLWRLRSMSKRFSLPCLCLFSLSPAHPWPRHLCFPYPWPVASLRAFVFPKAEIVVHFESWNLRKKPSLEEGRGVGVTCAATYLRPWDSSTEKEYFVFEIFLYLHFQGEKKCPCVASIPPSAVSASLPCSLVKSALPSDSNFTHMKRICIKTELGILLPGFSASQMYLLNTQKMSISLLMFLVPHWAYQCHSNLMFFSSSCHWPDISDVTSSALITYLKL